MRESTIPSGFHALPSLLRHEFHSIVMVALVATIHVFFCRRPDAATLKKSWMVGLKPTMTTLCCLGD
jgi:hypothetical protein